MEVSSEYMFGLNSGLGNSG